MFSLNLQVALLDLSLACILEQDLRDSGFVVEKFESMILGLLHLSLEENK